MRRSRKPFRASGSDEGSNPSPSACWDNERVHVSVTRVNTFDQPIANATMVGEEMLRWFRETEGFLGLLFVSKQGTTVALTFWESREVAERHRASRMQFRDRMTAAAGVEVVETEDYELTFAHLPPWEASGEGGI